MKKLDIFLVDSLNVDGSIIDFRIYDGHIFSTLVVKSSSTNKKIYGLDTFTGLPDPSSEDMKNPNINEIKQGQYNTVKHINPKNPRVNIITTDNYNDLNDIIESTEEFCFALVDVKQFLSTEKIMNFLWDRMSYGGTAYVYNYDGNADHSSHKAITNFIKTNDGHINMTRQMMVDGVKENFIAIKFFNPIKKPDKVVVPTNEKVTVAMVLKTGGKIYDYNYVNALAKNIKKHLTIDHEVVCLTDDPTNFSSDVDRTITLNNDYPTWWSKIELFREHQFNTKKVFYLDLDTIIVDNIDEIVSNVTKFSGLRDFYGLHSLGSGLMAWNTDHVSQIYTNFVPLSRSIIVNYREGDQKWIDEHKPSIDYFQDTFPNEIVSFKRHCVDPRDPNNITIPPKAKIICFHGNPRPHTVKHPTIIPHWQP